MVPDGREDSFPRRRCKRGLNRDRGETSTGYHSISRSRDLISSQDGAHWTHLSYSATGADETMKERERIRIFWERKWGREEVSYSGIVPLPKGLRWSLNEVHHGKSLLQCLSEYTSSTRHGARCRLIHLMQNITRMLWRKGNAYTIFARRTVLEHLPGGNFGCKLPFWYSFVKVEVVIMN